MFGALFVHAHLWTGSMFGMLLHAAIVASSSSSPATLSGASLYDALYDSGGYPIRNISRGPELLATLMQLNGTVLQIGTVLDVGCGSGFAVAQIWAAGFIASGIDISTVAIRIAHKLRGEPPGQCIPPCFQQSSATKLPWKDHQFDAIQSSDVLEHLESTEVDGAVAELARVASKMLLLKIPNRNDNVDLGQKLKLREFNDNASIAAREHKARGGATAARHRQYAGDLPGSLHPTIKPLIWWVNKFVSRNEGWQFHSKIPYPKNRPWLCCAFVLVRNETR